VFGNETYIFDKESIPASYKKVIIYGYGLIGQTFVRQIEKNSDLQIVGILDKQFESKRHLDSRIVSPENIENYDFDAVIIAIEDVIVSKAIIEWLIEKGIQKERIIWNV
jgi:glyceraldehyde-3-phosphate dehydrogenase/erythrose-4-phosphate dehydrogenase